jgi:hypothetical protein
MLCAMSRIAVVYFLTTIFAFHVSYAAEIDSVTPRRIHLDDSQQAINAIFNQRMLEGIEKANARRGDIEDLAADEYCDEEILYTELRKAMFQSFTASWGLKGYDLDKQLRELLAERSYSLSLNDSIYRDIDYFEGFSLNLKELSDVVKFNGHLVGLDKIGHFFSEGWQYFELSQQQGKNLDQAMQWGKEQESGKYGYSTTGIYSFADLVANFNGWRFWNRVLGKNNDPLFGILQNLLDKPYVSCDIQVIASIRHLKLVKAWERNRKVDMSLYIDGVWDEGNNCNSYADPVIEAKVTSRIHEVDSQFSCPLIPRLCVDAREKYGTFGKYLLHPSCLSVSERSGAE